MVIVKRQADLLEVVTATHPPGCLAGSLNGRQQQANQDPNDSDHNQ
jgi:hypothetical protein